MWNVSVQVGTYLFLTLKKSASLTNSVLEVALQSAFTNVVAASGFVKLQKPKRATLFIA